jgi:WD40 repeat protein
MAISSEYIVTSFDKTILVFDFTNEKYVIIPLIGHKGEVTSIKFVEEVLYSTDDEKTVIAWTIEDGKGFILS